MKKIFEIKEFKFEFDDKILVTSKDLININ